MNEALFALLHDDTPFDFFTAFIDDRIWNLIVYQTNLYATQQLTSKVSDDTSTSRKHVFFNMKKYDQTIIWITWLYGENVDNERLLKY